MDVVELKDKNNYLHKQMNDIVRKSDAERRDMTESETTQFNALYSQYLTNEQEILNAKHGNEQGSGRKTSPEPPRGSMRGDFQAPLSMRGDLVTAGDRIVLGKAKDGKQIRGYRPNEPLPFHGKPVGYSFGDWARASYSGDYSKIRAAAGDVQQEGVGSDGGFLVPTQFSQQLVELARARAQVLNAGAVVIPTTSNEIEFAKQETDPTAHWRGELQSITPSEATFSKVVFHSHSLAAIVTMSEELLMDSPNAGEVLQQALGQALGLKLDQAFLSGDGVGKPLGILTASGVQSVTVGGALSAYSKFSEAWGKILNANFTPNALLLNALTAAKLDALADTTLQPLQPPPSWNLYSHLVTNQLTETASASDAILGDFSNYWVAMRTDGVRIEFDRSGTVGGINAFSDLAVHIRCWLRADGQPVRPAAFVKLTNITTS
jgi:HK97 family phage major capsid protein